jgi:Fic family protein
LLLLQSHRRPRYSPSRVSPLSLEYIVWTHREFCSRLPPELLSIEDPKTKEKLPVVPGELRTRRVAVGIHVPPPPEDLPAFMARFEAAYRTESAGSLCQD